MSEQPIVLEPAGEAKNCVIWLHGLGADGHDFEAIVPELSLPEALAVRFVFPHAPMQPVTINNGFVMRSWYDIKGVDIGSQQDESGVRESQQRVEKLIQQQLDLGIASENIVLAGFSQGGAVILQTGLRYTKPLAGLMALSTYLPIAETLEQEKSSENQAVPVFMAHGDSDPVVRPELAYRSRALLESLNYPLEWNEYRGLQHGVSPQEIQDIREWLLKVLQ